jgi:predicted permease
VGALAPVFFVLLLGYAAGKHNEFDADQSDGLSKLALNFALPASLFVSMTAIPEDLLVQQGRLLLALTIAHVGLFVAAWLLLNLVKSLHGAGSLIYALALSTSATPVFGFGVLEPLLCPTAGPTIGLVALTINLIVPLAVVLLAMNEAAKHTQAGVGAPRRSSVLTGIAAGLICDLGRRSICGGPGPRSAPNPTLPRRAPWFPWQSIRAIRPVFRAPACAARRQSVCERLSSML